MPSTVIPRDGSPTEMIKDDKKVEAKDSVLDFANHLRTVNDYETFGDLKCALNFGSALHEGKAKNGQKSQDAVAATGGAERHDSNDGDTTDGALDPSFDWVMQNLDRETSEEQTMDDELKRLRILRSYLILDSAPEVNFDRLTTLGARVLKAPVCVVSLVDVGRIWFKSSQGTGETRQIPRNMAFCAHAIMSKEDVLIVPDALKDSRFKDNCLVSQPPYIRFYAGAPLVSPEGLKLGTFCILDVKPRPDGLSADDKQNLLDLSVMAVDLMVQRRKEENHANGDKSKPVVYGEDGEGDAQW